jgi:hypothetical protein
MANQVFPVPSPEDYERSAKDPDRPPAFRGPDFAMRFEQGKWSEDRLIDAINMTADFRAIPYGRSQVGPEEQARIREYWREYCAAESNGKRPDLLVLRAADYKWAMSRLGDDPTIVDEKTFAPVVERAVCGIEAENSLWVAADMTDYRTAVPLRKKNPKSPNVWVKDQDVPGLRVWMHHHQKPIVVAQVFYDLAYAIELTTVLSLARRISSVSPSDKDALSKQLGVFIKEQEYPDSRGGTTRKTVYVAHHSIATPFGVLEGEVTPSAKVIFGHNGRIMPYVAFRGGALRMTPEGIALLSRMAPER